MISSKVVSEQFGQQKFKLIVRSPFSNLPLPLLLVSYKRKHKGEG